MKMSRFATGFASVMCLLVILTGSSSALYLRPSLPTSHPTDPNDPYFEVSNCAFPHVTARKLLTNFLGYANSQTADCAKRQVITEDIVIVIEGSGSVGSCEFKKGKEAFIHLITTLHSPRYDKKYAAVTFGSTAIVNFKFLPSLVASREITKMPYPGGCTNSEAGLAAAKKLFDDPNSGRRPHSTRKILLFTDGDLTLPSASANALKASGVEIYVIAFGSYINGIDKIVKAASHPPEQYLFRVANYQGFWNITKLIVKQVSPGKYSIVNYDPPC